MDFPRLSALVLFSWLGAHVASAAEDWLFIDNGTLKLGIRKEMGGCIGWLSQSGSERNLLNHYDAGRFVQQSYYGDPDGSTWVQRPWRWNPVQGGSYRNEPATLVALESAPTKIYCRTTPKHWTTGADLNDVSMEQWIELKENRAAIRFRMTYTGTVSNRPAHQELPAIFFNSELKHLVFYTGAEPWTQATVASKTPGKKNEYDELGEHWAAWVDDKGWGAGFYNASATQMTDYRVEIPGGPKAAECSYFAPIKTFAITPGLVFEYEVSLILGTVEEIRSAAYQLHDLTKAR